MVMGGDSCSEGRGFESQHCILDGHFSHLFVVKIVMLFEKTKINEKEAGNSHFVKKIDVRVSIDKQAIHEPPLR